eukprot:scaffold16963_cov64-Phaeocystis_antarctica.AAC.3
MPGRVTPSRRCSDSAATWDRQLCYSIYLSSASHFACGRGRKVLGLGLGARGWDRRAGAMAGAGGWGLGD